MLTKLYKRIKISRSKKMFKTLNIKNNIKQFKYVLNKKL